MIKCDMTFLLAAQAVRLLLSNCLWPKLLFETAVSHGKGRKEQPCSSAAHS